MARILVALQEFKGTLTTAEANRIVAEAVSAELPWAQIDVAPLADGGPGTVESILTATGGSLHRAQVVDPLGRPIEAQWGLLPDGGTAIVEMAAASGLSLLRPQERDVRRATTYGTGLLLKAAIQAGCRRIWVGVGGSATVDGGIGALDALGAKALARSGARLAPLPEALHELARLDLRHLHALCRGIQIEVLADVLNPLLGPEGAAHTYGPQKGATAEDVQWLEAGLSHLAKVLRGQRNAVLEIAPGSGAGGGLAYGIAVCTGAPIRRGFDTIGDLIRLRERIAQADIVLTGEGRLDRQSTFMKGPYALATLARSLGRPVVIMAGEIVADPLWEHLFVERIALQPSPSRQPMGDASSQLRQAAQSWARAFQMFGHRAD